MKSSVRKSEAARRLHDWAICVALTAITLAIFARTISYGFINYDDPEYVRDNRVVSAGLTLEGAKWAFSGAHASNWHPLTWLSYMFDCQLFGPRPGGHHLTNVALHLAAVLALFLVLRRLTGDFWRSAFAAAVFAVHPLRAESVAWITDRKDVLSGVFFILTIWAYAGYAKSESGGNRGGAWRLSLVALFFVLGFMSKPMVVTLPLVLCLLDYWPLQRREPIRKLLLEKLPLLALSAAMCLITLAAQRGAIQSEGSFAFPHRLAAAAIACVVYLRQMIWPEGLAAFYPYPLNGWPAWEVLFAAAFLATVTAVAVRRRRTEPWLFTGWFWYLVMLLPVIGLIQAGGQAHADRYTYLPQIGIYVAVTWFVGVWAAKAGMSRAVVAGLMCAVVAALIVRGWRQTGYWMNSETLWSHALACTKDNDVALNNFGLALADEGRTNEAIADFRQALQINPGYAPAHVSLGNVYLRSGELNEAVSHFQSALQIETNWPEAESALGAALLQEGRVNEAVACFREVLRLRPDYAAHNNLGIALLKKGQVDEAIAEDKAAIQIAPNYEEAHNSLGNALLEEGNVEEAIAQFQRALEINPKLAKARNNLGKTLFGEGKADESIIQYRLAAQINPDYPEAHFNLGCAFRQQGKSAAAIVEFEKALQLDLHDAGAQYSLAWMLATSPEASLRNGGRAVQLASEANDSEGGRNPVYLHVLAAAFAEAGKFGDAVATAQKAIELENAAGQPDLANQFTRELKRYEVGLPLHQ